MDYGYGGNLLRLCDQSISDTPLPLIYTSKTERIQQAVERIVKSSSKEAHSTETTMGGAQVAESQTELGLMDVPHAQLIDLAAFREIQKQALILDTRPEIFHRFGHIPKALSLPREDFEATYDKQRVRLEKHKAHPVVLYCSGINCEDAEMVANALCKLGFTQLHLFRGGWNAWTQAKLPEEKTQ